MFCFLFLTYSSRFVCILTVTNKEGKERNEKPFIHEKRKRNIHKANRVNCVLQLRTHPHTGWDWHYWTFDLHLYVSHWSLKMPFECWILNSKFSPARVHHVCDIITIVAWDLKQTVHILQWYPKWHDCGPFCAFLRDQYKDRERERERCFASSSG